jgi:hypothetical protein
MMYFAEALCLLPQISFTNADKLKAILELFHCQLIGPLTMLPPCKSDNIAHILCFPLLHPFQLDIGMDLFALHLNGRAEVAF